MFRCAKMDPLGKEHLLNFTFSDFFKRREGLEKKNFLIKVELFELWICIILSIKSVRGNGKWKFWIVMNIKCSFSLTKFGLSSFWFWNKKSIYILMLKKCPWLTGSKKNRSAENPRNFVRKSLIKTKLRHV